MTRDEITDTFSTLGTDDGFADDEPTMPLVPQLLDAKIRRAAPPRLERIEGDVGPRTILLSPEPLTIGRSSQADVVLDSASLSRSHARVQAHDHGTVLTDLDSRNGVFLNGLRVHSAVLQDRDTVQIGKVVYLFLEGD